MAVVELQPSEEVVPRLSALGTSTVAEELAIAWSFAGSWKRRYESLSDRRDRRVVTGIACGVVIGALVAWALDGEAAQKIDHLLTWLGWLS